MPISARPAEADDRALPGHWEGDLLMGKGMSAIVTLVERSTRFAMLIALPDGHASYKVVAALAAHITTLPEQLKRIADVGPGQRDGRTRCLHRRHRRAGLFL